MNRGDRHFWPSAVHVKLTAEQLEALQRFLPEQNGVEGKLRYLISVMVEIAQLETQYRVAPLQAKAGSLRVCLVRLPEELYACIKAYGLESGLDVTKQTTSLVASGVELLERISGAGPLRKEELLLRARRELCARWGKKIEA